MRVVVRAGFSRLLGGPGRLLAVLQCSVPVFFSTSALAAQAAAPGYSSNSNLIANLLWLGLGIGFSGIWVWRLKQQSRAQKEQLDGVARDLTDQKKNAKAKDLIFLLSQKLGSTNSRKEAARVIADAADKLLGWDGFCLDLYDPGTDRIHTVLIMDEVRGQRIEVPGNQAIKPSKLARRIIQGEGELILRQRDPTFDAGSTPIGDTARPSVSMLLMPIRDQDRCCGAVGLHSYQPNAYTPADLETLRSLAGFCAGALRRIDAEEARAAADLRFAKAFEATPVALAITNHPDFRVVDVNQSFLQLFRLQKDAVVGAPLSQLPIWENASRPKEFLSEKTPGPAVRNVSARFRTSQGELLETLVSFETIHSDEEASGLLIIVDTTERVRLEAQLWEVQQLKEVLPDPVNQKSILVVEDEAPLRKLVTRVLAAEGYRVLSAANGEEALELWDRVGGKIDLLLTDLMMPGSILGKGLAKILMERNAGLKVIYTSGYATDSHNGSIALQEGVNFLSKPYRPARLTALVRAHLEDHSAEIHAA